MSSKLKYTLGMMMYLFLNSVFFGVVFAQKQYLLGLAAAIGAQIIMALIIILIVETELRKHK